VSAHLAPYACDPAESRGRLHDEPGGEQRGPRDVFQRDRDRIIHSISFRRLRHKTQVFIAPDGDHYRVRLTHSLEVAQIGRAVARTLGLNEDLTEGLCLAHDIGHPPFGHAGEDALKESLTVYGGFDHNAHCIRTLTQLENAYPTFPGLNLTWETLEGLAKHNGPVTAPNWAMREADAAFPLELSTWPSLEAQIAAIADDIAYDNHDIDDGLRAGILSLEQILSVPLVARCWDRVRARFPDHPADRLMHELVREQIGVMVNDLLQTTRTNLVQTGLANGDAQAVRDAGRPIAAFSDEMREAERTLKSFMYANLYYHPAQVEAADRAKIIVADLFDAYHADPTRMGEVWDASCSADEPMRSRHITDYIAGMTDRFAEQAHRGIYGNKMDRRLH
jgi:dGTPase